MNGLIEVAANVRRRRLRRTAGERRRTGDRRDHRGDGELRIGPGGKGFAIPINQAMAIADQIRSRAPSDTVHIGPPTLLGVGVAAATRRAACRASSSARCCAADPPPRPASSTATCSPASTATPLDSATTLTYVLDRHYPGDVVDLTWIDRSGQQRTGKATLVSGP